MRWISIITVLLCGLGWSAVSVAEGGPKKEQYFISLLGGYYDDPSNTDLRRGDSDLGVTLGGGITDRWSVEAMLFRFDPDVEVGGIRGNGDMEYWSVNFLGKLGSPTADWQPYVTFGGGRARYEFDGLRRNTHDNLYNVGVGFFSNLTEHLVFRADVRGVYHNNADSFSPMATAGLSLMLGDPPAAPPPADSDGDGVPDYRDDCPNTPAGTRVDERGCPLDSDGDGVPDFRDDCPNTPAGVSVDARGCPLDSDGDGVPDYRDDCPNTPAGARVDERGCEVQLERDVSFDLTVQFAFNSAEITGVAFQEMLELLRFLREYPSTTAVIEGHTDSVGPEQYNQELSQRRAQSVVEALTNSGVQRDRLTARGYGESRPIASNATEEGRAQNRRVTVVVSGTTTQAE